MWIQIPESGIIKKQKIDLNNEVIIIYGYNNSGKTTFLKTLDQAFQNRLMEKFISDQVGELAIYIPTNRIIVSENNTDELLLKDYEEFIYYQKDSYRDYSLHLKRLRDHLLTNKTIHNFVCCAVCKIFGIDIREINSRYSDGIENIINIYLNVIWAMTWDVDVSDISEEMFYKMLIQKQIYVMIDEIEMFLHVNVQSKLISSLKEDFAGCRFIMTTHSPLLLTRYMQCVIYNIMNGKLDKIQEDVYYEDLDIIYEELFKVEQLPPQVREDINYLGNIILKGRNINTERVTAVAGRLREEYPNLYRRYNKIITKAQNIGEHNGKDL